MQFVGKSSGSIVSGVVSVLVIFAVIEGCSGCNGLLLSYRWWHLRRLC